MAFPTRTLGRSGLEVTAVSIGAWALGGTTGGLPNGYAGIDDAEAQRALYWAAEAGATFIDTADIYGLGHSERSLAPVLRDYPDIRVATKVGNSFDEAAQVALGANLTPAYIHGAVRASLSRLGRDVIDVYQLHTFPLTAPQVDDLIAVFEDLVSAGLIRWYGVSNDDPDQIRRFATGDHCTSAQIQLNVFDDNAPALAACAETGLGALCRSPLAMGLLGGRYSAANPISADDIRGRQPEWLKWFTDGVPSPDYWQRLESVRALLTADGRTLAQGALGWILARSDFAVPLPGFKTQAQLAENLGTLAAGPLAPPVFAKIEATLGRAAG
ncbi:MAG: aldo/keto reductase [Propionibacteriaceae bacterium]|jgi:aryl-alcohol dehydrogenase-like predicted oxidoreductase|nr:aldo/keto reductase [Propionibacteriaceae bacterium]